MDGQCNLLLETARELCKQNRHPLIPQNARKRFFKCQNCQQRTEALNCIMPAAACARCGGTDYLRVGMRDVRRAMHLTIMNMMVVLTEYHPACHALDQRQPPKVPELHKLQTHVEDHPSY